MIRTNFNLDYAGYYDRLKRWKERNLQFDDSHLDESFSALYASLYMNDQIELLLMEAKDAMARAGLFRQQAKRLYNLAWKEMKHYTRRIQERINVPIDRFADMMQSMEDQLRPHLQRIYYAVSQSLLSQGVEGERNTVLSKLALVQILCAANHAAVDKFREETRRLVGIESPHLDYLYMARLRKPVLELEAQLEPQIAAFDLTTDGRILQAFNLFASKLLDRQVFRKTLLDTAAEQLTT